MELLSSVSLVRILRNFVFYVYCMSVSIYRKQSFQISCRLWKYWLQLYCLLIAFCRHSFTEASISGVISHKQAHISRLGLWLVHVAQGLVRVRKIYRPDVWRGLPCAAKGVTCSFASHYLASQHLCQLELTDLWAAFQVRYCQGLSETLKNWKIVLHLHCTCIVRNTLEQCLQSPCCCFFKIKS